MRNEIDAERGYINEALRAANGIATDELRERAVKLKNLISRQHRACIADAVKGGGMLPQAPPFDLEALERDHRDLKTQSPAVKKDNPYRHY